MEVNMKKNKNINIDNKSKNDIEKVENIEKDNDMDKIEKANPLKVENMEGPDNNSKINFTFEIPITEDLVKLGFKEDFKSYEAVNFLDKHAGNVISEYFREKNPNFEGKIVVDKINNGIISGQYQSESNIKTKDEKEVLNVFRDKLKEITNSENVKAEINLACFF